MIVLQVVASVLCVAFFVYVVHLVAQERLLLKYSLLWMALTAVILLCALFPLPLFEMSHVVGFESPSNFVFFIGLFFLLAITLSLSSIVSKQSILIKNLVQEQALLAKKLEVQQAKLDKSERSAIHTHELSND